MDKLLSSDLRLALACLLAAAAFLALIVWAVMYDAKVCAAKGGRIHSQMTSGIGVAANGQIGPTFGSVSFCLSPDGRILN